MKEHLKKNWLYYLVGLIVLILIYKFYKDSKKPNPSSSDGGSGSSSSSVPDYNKVLSNGSTGSEVSTLQNMLNARGYSLAVDGIFGTNTEAALFDNTGLYETTLNQFISGSLSNPANGIV